MRLLSIPPSCDVAEIQVEIRQGQRLAPNWLSSPTRSEPLKCFTDDNSCPNKCMYYYCILVLLQPRKYQLSKSILHEIKVCDIAKRCIPVFPHFDVKVNLGWEEQDLWIWRKGVNP